MKLRLSIEELFVFCSIFLLSIYLLVKRVHTNELFPFGDHLAMNTLYGHMCTLDFSQTWTPPIQCLNVLLGEIFAIPIIYLLVTLLIKIAIFGSLLFVYKTLYLSSDNTHQFQREKFGLVLGVFCVLLIAIGGGGRLLIGGGDIILHSTIASRQWAQILVLFAFIFFIKRQYLWTGLVLGLCTFLHPANTFHVIVILFGALLIVTTASSRTINVIRFVVPTVFAIIVQYVAAYGMPTLIIDFGSIFEFERGVNTQTNSTSLSGSSILDWYKFVYSQDPDDLSLIWVLLFEYTITYSLFIVWGFYLAWKVEGTNQLRALLSKPAIAISLVSVMYFSICVAIEYFRFPEILLKQLIVVQPRRALYLPILFSCYYIVRYTLEFFWISEYRTQQRWVTLIVFYSWFYFSLILTSFSNEVLINSSLIFLTYITVIGSITFYFFGHSKLRDAMTLVLRNTRSLAMLGMLLVLIKTIPFSTASVYTKIETMFFSWGPNSLSDYIQVSAELESDQVHIDYLKMAEWISENTDTDASFITAGLYELMVQDLKIVIDGRDSASLNPYYARGGTHYSQHSYNKHVPYFVKTLGVDESDLGSNGAASIGGLEEILTTFDTDQLKAIKFRGGRSVDYFLTTYNLALPRIISFGEFTLYNMRDE